VEEEPAAGLGEGQIGVQPKSEISLKSFAKMCGGSFSREISPVLSQIPSLERQSV
jgi:hypothetical protein